MFFLILGVALWSAAHLAKRVVPGFHKSLGGSERPMVTAALIIAVLLMIWGYRSADGDIWWGPTAALKGINNLMVLAGFYLFAAAGMKTAITRKLRHPMLTGFILWSAGHLLVNGDLPSLILFGGLTLWALAEIVLINRAERWTPPQGPLNPRKEIMALIGGVIVFGVVAMIHKWLGYNPFGA
ncbi:MAG: NnrU family protein [Paracoccus sp. (in: a-proteobacteria)]|uniref:NnrU family protein n=1 Tax=Paracoccus sp. TaxID=267 RepID=UPI0026DEE9F0|nr:NnrU family protein [Paracoccus sp. (in: a-proteobacteria)]MDO5621522.1 NnrU family protein [Paracoccus sp. (in: a-proteobacteria)]